VRCGVVHQYYPKNIDIVAVDKDDPFVQSQGKPYVNGLGFYRTTLRGLTKVYHHIVKLSDSRQRR
jgi:hypothetical protein